MSSEPVLRFDSPLGPFSSQVLWCLKALGLLLSWQQPASSASCWCCRYASTTLVPITPLFFNAGPLLSLSLALETSFNLYCAYKSITIKNDSGHRDKHSRALAHFNAPLNDTAQPPLPHSPDSIRLAHETEFKVSCGMGSVWLRAGIAGHMSLVSFCLKVDGHGMVGRLIPVPHNCVRTHQAVHLKDVPWYVSNTT